MLFLILVLFLLIGGVLTLITLQNLNTLTHLNLYFWKTPQIPVGLLLIAAMLLGAVLIYLIAFLAAMRERRELKRLRARVAELEAGQRQQAQAAMGADASMTLISQQTTAPVLPVMPQMKMPGSTGPLSGPPRN
ncbi:MAG TPA: LapA family protein [Ktedonobacteraceae bacterium]